MLFTDGREASLWLDQAPRFKDDGSLQSPARRHDVGGVDDVEGAVEHATDDEGSIEGDAIGGDERDGPGAGGRRPRG